MVNSYTVPCGMSSCAFISGAGVCVGPIMKSPSALAGGMAPSDNSLATTYPGVWGSRAGGVGRAGRAGTGCAAIVGDADWAAAEPGTAIKTIKNAALRRRYIEPLAGLDLPARDTFGPSY